EQKIEERKKWLAFNRTKINWKKMEGKKRSFAVEADKKMRNEKWKEEKMRRKNTKE
ncbi:hypothetical protein RUM43_013514, partial [Polyplax serrata]